MVLDGDGREAAADFAQAALQLAPPADFENAVRAAMEEVSQLTERVFGKGSWVMPFGSFVQGVQLTGSDLDLCVQTSEDASGAGRSGTNASVAALKLLMGRLPRSFRVKETRFWKHIKVPIIVLSYDASGTSDVQVELDISMGMECDGVDKGWTDRLVRRILLQSPRAFHMVRIIKLWAKLEKLNKAYDGFLNSLAWTLLVIYFFVERGEIAHAAIQEETSRGEDDEGRARLPEPLELDLAGGDAPEGNVPDPLEVAEFFEWLPSLVETWPEDLPDSGWGISILDCSLVEVPPASKQWKDQCRFYIEDPGARFLKGARENVTRALRQLPWSKTLDKCKAAAEELKSPVPGAADAWLRDLLERAAAERAATLAALSTPKAQAPWRPGAATKVAGTPWRPPWEAPTARRVPPPGLLQPSKRARTGMCKWFAKGDCWSGANCSMSHG